MFAIIAAIIVRRLNVLTDGSCANNARKNTGKRRTRHNQTGDDTMKTGKWIICMPKLYRYDGWLFEVHSYFGAWPLKKDLDTRKRAGRKFFKMYERFKNEKNKAQFEA